MVGLSHNLVFRLLVIVSVSLHVDESVGTDTKHLLHLAARVIRQAKRYWPALPNQKALRARSFHIRTAFRRTNGHFTRNRPFTTGSSTDGFVPIPAEPKAFEIRVRLFPQMRP